jgi:hypothetical protein
VSSHHVREGKVVAEFWAAKGPVKVPRGLIHDWIDAAFIRDARIEDVPARLQDYTTTRKSTGRK